MESNQAPALSDNFTVLPGKSWLNYLGIFLLAIAALLTAGALFAATQNGLLTSGFVTLAIFLLGLKYYSLKSVKLYFDAHGVWLQSGFLPWTRGVRGVKWRDLDEAQFTQSFWSWLTRAYNIRLTHRFTKDNEIVLSKMHQGAASVEKINAAHRQFVAANVINSAT